MASKPAYEAIRLIDPLLLNCVEASQILERTNLSLTIDVMQPLNSIEKSLVRALVLLLSRTDHGRHPFRSTSLEENCFRATLRGCADLMSTLSYNLSLVEVGKSPVATTWPDVQNLLKVYDKYLANLLGILSPRGLREGRKDVCDTLKEIDIFEQEPPRGQRFTRLLRAIDKGSVKGIELLTDLGVDVNQKSSVEDAKPPVYLPLSYAARRDTAIVDLLIKKGADINARDHFGNNALLSAASSGRDEIIELLLSAPYNADIEVQRTGTDECEGFTPLMLAVYSGHVSSIQALLARGAKRDVVTRAGDSLLHIAASRDKLRTTEFLLANGSQAVTINENTGETALHCAVRKQSLEVAMFLIEKGPLLLEAENKKKQTPLALAVKLKKPQMVKMLLEKGAKPDRVDADERTPLHNAVIAKDSEILRLLVERGAKVESLDNDGRTPLHHAVRTEDPTILAMLLSSGHKWSVMSRSGRYPLQYVMEMPPARESQALSLLREFLKFHRRGTSFYTGYHALPRAAREGKLQHVKEMLNHDPELVDKSPLAASGYQPPLHEAVKAGKVEVVKELCAPRSYTLSLDKRDHRGNTALHQAILSNQVAMISLLIEKGADKELLSGQTEGLLPPLHLASRERNLLAVKTLLRKGVDAKRRVTNVPLCDMCRTMMSRPNGGNARCVLRNLDSSLRGPDFQELDNVLRNALRA